MLTFPEQIQVELMEVEDQHLQKGQLEIPAYPLSDCNEETCHRVNQVKYVSFSSELTQVRFSCQS